MGFTVHEVDMGSRRLHLRKTHLTEGDTYGKNPICGAEVWRGPQHFVWTTRSKDEVTCKNCLKIMEFLPRQPTMVISISEGKYRYK